MSDTYTVKVKWFGREWFSIRQCLRLESVLGRVVKHSSSPGNYFHTEFFFFSRHLFGKSKNFSSFIFFMPVLSGFKFIAIH